MLLCDNKFEVFSYSHFNWGDGADVVDCIVGCFFVGNEPWFMTVLLLCYWHFCV